MRPDKPERGQAVFWIILAAFGVLSLEIVSWAFVELIGKERFQYHVKIDDDEFARDFLNRPVQKSPDANTSSSRGWDEKTQTDGNDDYLSGGRNTPYLSETVKIVTYGDSFTYGQDVNDDQTWQYYLSEMTGTKVLNYGVRGYGTDQALLKLKEHLERGYKRDIIILGVLSENIARVVNISPKYYWSVSKTLAMKPVLARDKDGYKWIVEQLQNQDTREGRLKALKAMESYDYWYEYNKLRPSFNFPYSLSVIKAANYFLFKTKRWPDLWREKRPVGVMKEIIKKFYGMSVEHGFTPVVLFIPEGLDLKEKEKGNESFYAKFVKELLREYSDKGLIVVDAMEESFDLKKFYIAQFIGHASPYGNRIIAKALYGNIEDE